MAETPPELQLNVTTVYLLLGRLEQKVEAGFDGINERLDTQNGKVTRHEAEIAVLKDRSTAAERKATEAVKTASEEVSTVKGRAAKWAAIASAALITIIETVKALWSHAPGQ
jgi:hypothetical protein